MAKGTPMQETVREVFFETRHHATVPLAQYSSPHQDVAKKGIFSLLSARGLNVLKEKWSEGKLLTPVKKWASIFISPGGKHVAVAVRNRLTIFQKDDNYMLPCGIFTCDNRQRAFTHGAWSDSHDVLGVIDDINTLYFIGSNGEEISRITKRQLKTRAWIIGLIVQESIDEKNSCLCVFNILMSDGLLHRVEVSQNLSASISYMATSTNHISPSKQFPQNVCCMDFHPKLSILVLVCASNSVSEDSRGLYFLSLWRVIRDSDLKHLFCTPHFDGLFSLSRGSEMHVSIPKVAISPSGKHLAALDLTGHLDIFDMDRDLYSFSAFALKENCVSQRADKSQKKWGFLNDILDFTWWSDHVLVIAKINGIVSMFDILEGVKCLEHEPVFCMPFLERVQLCHGFVFLLDSTVADGRHLPTTTRNRDAVEIQDVGRVIGDQLEVNRSCWSLFSFSERSASEMYTILIKNKEYPGALEFANLHGLDTDEVFKSQWLNSGQGAHEINMLLSNVKDIRFILSECAHKIGSNEDSMKALLSLGLRMTDQYRFAESENESNLIWHFRMFRLQLLQFKDRLETFVGINMGRFSALEYKKFRIMPLHEAAVMVAESGKIGALNLLFKRHLYSLVPVILNVLSAIPETVPVQTYSQLLPGRHLPSMLTLRDSDWVECQKMVDFIDKISINNESSLQVRTEHILKQCKGLIWPTVSELCLWYKNRARDIDSLSGQLDNCISMLEFACSKGISELQDYLDDVSYFSQLIYSNTCDEKVNFSTSLVAWEQLSDYDKFKMMLVGVEEDTVLRRLLEMAVPFMQKRACTVVSTSMDSEWNESFLIRWLKEISVGNNLHICLRVIEEGCRDPPNVIFQDAAEALEITLQCIYLCSLTNSWHSMASILSKFSHFTSKGNIDGCLRSTHGDTYFESLERRFILAEGHVEAGRILAYYQVPKPMSFFLGAHSDEKGVKQLLRLILSKFGLRHPGRSDDEWANMWHDMQCLQEKAFSFLDMEYMLSEFCRGLLKAGKFVLARDYLKGTSTITLATEKAENLVVQAAREYFFSASNLACPEIWKAKECLNLFPNSKSVKAESDVIDALTVKLPNYGVNLLPMQYRQMRNPMEIINMVVTSQTGNFLDADEVVEIAKLLGLTSEDDTATVEEAVARGAAVIGDLQQAFDLCVILSRKGHGPIWDLCAAIARGPALDNMDTSSRKLLLGFALSHCDEESIGELLHAWKDLDAQFQCEKLAKQSGENLPQIYIQGSSHLSPSVDGSKDVAEQWDCMKMVNSSKQEGNDKELYFRDTESLVSSVAKKNCTKNGSKWQSLLRKDRKFLSFATLQLPWLLALSGNEEYGKIMVANDEVRENQFMSVRAQAMLCILSWLARNDIAPLDDLIASLAKSVMEPPATNKEDNIGCSFLLNLTDAFHGVQIIEEQLRKREDYIEICSMMEVGMTYCYLHNAVLDCSSPSLRKELLLRKFQEKHALVRSDAMGAFDKSKQTFWGEWKSKLEDQKRYADQSRVFEQIMPSVETNRFLSGDLEYIQNAVFSFIDSLKLEKKSILKEALKLADSYGLNRTEVLLRYLANALISDLWTNDDIISEISCYKVEMLSSAVQVINTVSFAVFPAIDGSRKLRLSYLYELLSECYSHLEDSNEQMVLMHHRTSCKHNIALSQFYKVLEQECGRVSFIKSLNFKNIAGLRDLNFECFNKEVYSHISEPNLESLSKLVDNLLGLYDASAVHGFILWQDVYRYHIENSLDALEIGANLKLHPVSPKYLSAFLVEIHQNYGSLRLYIRFLSEKHFSSIVRRYYALSLPHFCSDCCLPHEKEWNDCLVLLLNFWIQLTDEIQEIIAQEDTYEEESKSRCLSKCLKSFLTLVVENEVSTIQGWFTMSDYVNQSQLCDYKADVLGFCKAMLFCGCNFKAISTVFAEAAAASTSLRQESARVSCRIQSIPDFYASMADLVLMESGSGSVDNRKLHYLVSSLSNMEGDLEDLRKARYAIWERLSQYSGDMQVASHLRVYYLELMQSIAGRKKRGVPAQLISEVQQWERWGSHSNLNDIMTDMSIPKQFDGSSSTVLVALKSTQLLSAISPNIEVSPEELSTLESAVSCFLRISEASCTESHLAVLQTVIEEWEGLFIVGREEESHESPVCENTWSNDGWDNDGWESFQEEPIENQRKKAESICIHPLHACWMVVVRKYIELSHFSNLMQLIDHSLSKTEGILLSEEEAKSFCDLLVEIDCFRALKIMLLLPYESLWFRCLGAVDAKLKKEGSSGTLDEGFELLAVAVSSGILSTIADESKYAAFFSYACSLVGHLSHCCQESRLSLLRHGSGRKGGDDYLYILFSRVLFPSFISELVKAKHFLLAGFLVCQFMHTNASFSLINILEASLRKYLEGQVHTHGNGVLELDKLTAHVSLPYSFSRLRDKLGALLQSALSALPAM